MKANNSKSNKVYNRNTILKMIALYAPISRIELATRTGLSKMSLTNIISEFKEEGLVTEIGIDSSASGKRKPILLELTDGSLCAIGVHITRSYVAGGLTDIKGNLIYSVRENLPENVTKDSLSEIILKVISDVRKKKAHKIAGIGIASMGPLDLKNGIILNPSNFYGIEDLKIVDIVKEKNPDLPVYLCKNTVSAVLAERYYGKGQGVKNFCYLGVSKGIGCGAVVNDCLITGANGFSCEVGHISVNPEGPLCACGNRGCVELYASLNSAESFAEEEIKKGETTSLKSPVSYCDIISAAEKGDALSNRVLDRQCKYLSIAVTNLMNVFDPELVIVGNEITAGGEMVVDRISHFVGNVPISAKIHNTPIVLSDFRDKAPLIGSATYVFEMNFFK